MLNETACVADDDGHTCTRAIVMSRPVPLCSPHKAELALTIVPDLLRDQLAAALRDAANGVSPIRNDLVETAAAVPHLRLLDGGQHDTIVYFIANGGRVKIGFTTNLKTRLSSLALRPDSVLIALAGGPDLERALHAHFQAHRDGNTEWFELAPAIFRYITARQGITAPVQSEAATVTVVRRTRKIRPGKKAPRRSPTEWADLAGPVFFAERARLGRQPTAVEFSQAIDEARLGKVAPTTAKKIRADILARPTVGEGL